MQALSGTSSKGKTINSVGSCLQSVLLPQAAKSQLTFHKLGGSLLGLVTAAAADGPKIILKKESSVISGGSHN